MKRHPYLLLAIPIVAVGCGAQPSTPLAVEPVAKPVAQVQQGVDISPSRAKPLGKMEDPLWREDGRATRVKGPLVSSPSTAVAAAAPSAEAKPPAIPSDSAGTRPKADREPTKPGDPEKITFDDLILGMQADMVYRPFMLTDRAKELEGKRVRLPGEMLPYEASKKVKEFILLRNNKCLYGKGGQADHLALVLMKPGHALEYTGKTVRMEGTLKIMPISGEDGNTKHLYVLENAVAK